MENKIIRVFLLIIGLLLTPILLAAVACGKTMTFARHAVLHMTGGV
jgi:hypothetical protein